MQTVERVVRIMQRLGDSPQGVTLSELSRAVGLAPATCHRLVNALAAGELVERDDATRRWRPGVGLARIAASVSPAPGFAELATPTLTELRDRWQMCFFLSVLADGQVVCVRTAEPDAPHRMGVYVPLGRRMALHATASAKAILCALEPEAARALLVADTPLERFTRFTRTTLEDVEAQLVEARRLRYATCDQEVELGVSAHAAVIAAPPGESPRSLGVIAPRAQLREASRRGLVQALTIASDQLSELTSGRAHLTF
jgi:DNA-binding IclR family transcriptional regulator